MVSQQSSTHIRRLHSRFCKAWVRFQNRDSLGLTSRLRIQKGPGFFKILASFSRIWLVNYCACSLREIRQEVVRQTHAYACTQVHSPETFKTTGNIKLQMQPSLWWIYSSILTTNFITSSVSKFYDVDSTLTGLWWWLRCTNVPWS